VVNYRNQVIVSDLLSIATSWAGVGLLGYVFGAPIVHLANRNSSSAWKSFTLRVVVPVGVGFEARPVGVSWMPTAKVSDRGATVGIIGSW
jgi:hypothetical protein